MALRALLCGCGLLFALLAAPAGSQEHWATYNSATASCAGAPDTRCGSTFDSAAIDNACAADKRVRFAVSRRQELETVVQSASQRTARAPVAGRSIKLLPRPGWVVNAAWSERDDSIILADSTGGALIRFDLSGHVLDKAIIDPAPVRIFRNVDGYVTFDKVGAIRVLGGDFGKKADYAPQEGVVMHNGIPFDSTLLFFGDVQLGDEWKSGVFRSGFDGKGACLLYEMDRQKSLARPTYLLGYPMLARVGTKGYVLALEERPFIIEAGIEARKLGAFPPGEYRRPPSIPRYDQRTEPDAFSAAARSTSAAALLAWGDFLYVLTRRPAGLLATDWALWRIDPASDTVDMKPIHLPTTAPHLIVVPGNRYWAIIEKGPVRPGHVQDTEAMVLMDAATVVGAPQQRRPNQPRMNR